MAQYYNIVFASHLNHRIVDSILIEAGIFIRERKTLQVEGPFVG